MQMKRLIGHKWVIGAAALIMVFAIAGIAVAANTTTSGTGTAATAGPDASGNGVAPGGPMMGGRGGRRGGGMGLGVGQGQNGVRQQMRDATQKLVREKMSATDQAAYDQLIAQQKEQQTALENAAKALRDTNQQIREMIAKTLGVTLPTTTTT
jgi:Spy/CpxP family protein refolding chaperone